MIRLLALAGMIIGGTAATILLSAQQPTPARVAAEHTAGAWLVEGAARSGDLKIENFLGRQSLWLRAGTHAIKADGALIDGTVEFDLAPMDRADFVAIVLRRESLANHENLYLRARASGQFMAIQYAPRMNGSSTWQLYPEFTARVSWPRNQWTHVRVEMHGSRLDAFVGDSSTPAVSVPRLRHSSTSASELAFWARVNDRPAEWAAAISNLRITPAASPAPRLPAAAAPPPEYVSSWEITAPIKTDASIIDTVPTGLSWRRASPEESGLVNLNAYYAVQPQQGRFVVYARTVIDAKSPGRRLAGIGYSDDVTVFVNGEATYSGINGWDSRSPELVSFVKAGFERVWLPLKAGRNDVVLAVSDDQRFGWGFAMMLDR